MSTAPNTALLNALRTAGAEIFAPRALSRPALHPAQVQIKREAKRFNVPCCGRRFGKTLFCIDLALDVMQAGYPVGWFAPTYKILDEAWRDIKEVLKPITEDKSEQQKRIVTKGGGSLECWSLEPPGGEEAGRSRKYKRVIVDEAGRVVNLQTAWNRAIAPTLIDLRGDAWFPSTPNGYNFYHTLYSWGQDPAYADWQSWQMPSSANPYLPADEIEKARRERPQLDFQQEYLAQFIEDAGVVFRNLLACSTGKEQRLAIPKHTYVIGCDWAKSLDFSTFSVIDTTLREQCRIERFNQIDYLFQIDRLKALCEQFQPEFVISERTGNLALAEFLRLASYRRDAGGFIEDASIPLLDFNTTNASKQAIIQALALALERAEIKILPNPVQMTELQAFTMERLPSGAIRYAAPEGMHDDTVIALALSWHQAQYMLPELNQTKTEQIHAMYDKRRLRQLTNAREQGATDAYLGAIIQSNLIREQAALAGVEESGHWLGDAI